MKTPPTGLGLWISWNGPATKDRDAATLVATAKGAGVQWICAKIGDDGRSTRWLQRGAELISCCKQSNIGIYTWNYSKPDTWEHEVDAIAATLAQGSMGHVIDAETEWEYVAHNTPPRFSSTDRRAAASAFMAKLRAEVGDAFIAHAPIWDPLVHPGFPWAEFGARCDAVMPQFYWTAAGQTASVFCSRADAIWQGYLKAHPWVASNVWPIGITYGLGDGWDNLAGRLTAQDVDDFIARYPGIPVSLFSWDAANQACWSALTRRAETLPPDSLGPLAADPDIDYNESTPDPEKS